MITEQELEEIIQEVAKDCYEIGRGKPEEDYEIIDDNEVAI